MARRVQPERASCPDVLIAGAGIIGLSLALELRRRGASITVLDSAAALGGASSAAAGMLAAEDPHNPPALLPFSRYSLSLYPDFLARVEALSARPVPFQTSHTIQYTAAGAQRLDEHSLEPRQLGAALLEAATAASIRIIEHVTVARIAGTSLDIDVETGSGEIIRAKQFVHTTGAWAPPDLQAALFPRKGQMLRVTMPPGAPLQEVHRAEHIYVVPRFFGPQAGTALVGATIEDAGFDLSTTPGDLQQLRQAAARLGPQTAFVADAPQAEAWAGLRPCTPDLLPLLGKVREREWVATGHFRNGILLAPGTAALMADLLGGSPLQIETRAFSPDRFALGRKGH